ncbi:unnamed protein product [Natator depressus]
MGSLWKFSDLSADVFRSAMKDFVDDYLTRAAIFESMNRIVTEVVQMVLPIILREALQEMEYEAILQEVISQVVEEDTKALAHSVLGDYAKMIKLQQSQITAIASKQLIDTFLLEHLIGMTSTYDPEFGGKEHSSVLASSSLAFRSSSRLPLKMFRWEISIKKLLLRWLS